MPPCEGGENGGMELTSDERGVLLETIDFAMFSESQFDQRGRLTDEQLEALLLKIDPDIRVGEYRSLMPSYKGSGQAARDRAEWEARNPELATRQAERNA